MRRVFITSFSKKNCELTRCGLKNDHVNGDELLKNGAFNVMFFSNTNNIIIDDPYANDREGMHVSLQQLCELRHNHDRQHEIYSTYVDWVDRGIEIDGL